MMKKRIGLIADILMFALLVAQMLYVFTGNNVHEILGIGFFICLIVHVIIKGWWFSTLFKKGRPASKKAFDTVTALLLLCIIVLMISSMGISRFLFPNFVFLGSAALHRYLATAVLTLAVLHGSMVGIRRAQKKKTALVLTALACILSLSLGLFGVPYMNRHFKAVSIDHQAIVSGEKVDTKGTKCLAVYFTRVGNTDFEPDVDAVSGASLLISDGELYGSNALIADMVSDILGCDTAAITLTGEKYPSSYNDTVSVAVEELLSQARPATEPIDVSGYDDIILIYPLWWNSIPMPVASFLENSDLSGKRIFLVCTQGSSGYGSTISETEALTSGASVTALTSIYCEDIPDARDELYTLLQAVYEKGEK